MQNLEPTDTPQSVIAPAWVPRPVQQRLEKLLAVDLRDRDLVVLQRLIADPRMQSVWVTLGKYRARQDRFAYPQNPDVKNQTEIQEDALADSLSIAFISARTDNPPTLRVQSACVSFFQRRFGKSLYGTAATLANVALGHGKPQ